MGARVAFIHAKKSAAYACLKASCKASHHDQAASLGDTDCGDCGDGATVEGKAVGLDLLPSLREEAPFKGAWALPDGFVRTNEDASLEDAARRVLADKAGARSPYLEQFQTFGGPKRDPRGWALTVAYFPRLADDPKLDDTSRGTNRPPLFRARDPKGLVLFDRLV